MKKIKPYDLNYGRDFGLMSNEEFNEAINLRDKARLQNGGGGLNYNLAINSIIEGNMRLIINQARKYSNMYRVPIEDAISEGVLAFRAAANLYDPLRGKIFFKFAVECMKRHFFRALPFYAGHPIILKAGQRRKILLLKENINSSPKEDLADLKILAKKAGISCSRAGKLMQMEKLKRVNIEEIISNGEAGYGIRKIDSVATPDRIVETRETREIAIYWLRKALKELEISEYEIIAMRFGLVDKSLTLEKIGKNYGVTRERIRQMEGNILRKLRRKLSPKLEDHFLER